MFLFKKVVAQLLSPTSLILELTFAGLLLLLFTAKQKAGRALILSGFLILAFCSFTHTSDMLVEPLRKQYPSYIHNNLLPIDEMPKIIVVLGAGYDSDPGIPIASHIGYDSLVRLIEGIRIYRLITDSKLILSGGGKKGSISSAQDMAELAKELGVNEQDIIIEEKSRDTKDEAVIIKSIIGSERFILVTSALHMPRSMALFKKIGMNPIPAPTRAMEERLYYRNPNPFFPSSVNLQKAEMAFHEYLGIVWAKLRRQI